MEERLQKILAAAGVASRRKAEELIRAGRVMVNGRVVRELGLKADLERDEVHLDGEKILPARQWVYYMLHKPEGFITTTADPPGRPTVMHLMKGVHAPIFPVGRLDYDSSGLLLLTNDGELAHFLTRPGSGVPKIYHVKVRERISPEKIAALARGPRIGGPPLNPARVRFMAPSRSGRHSWLEITITEGRTRQVRRMCAAVGHPVIKLKRIGLGPLRLGNLPPGEFRALSKVEVEALRRLREKSERRKEHTDEDTSGQKSQRKVKNKGRRKNDSKILPTGNGGHLGRKT